MADVILTIVDEAVELRTEGDELLVPHVAAATIARAGSEAAKVVSQAKSIEAGQYAAAASALANRYSTFAAGAAASAAGVDFTVVDATGVWINVYRKGTSTEATPLIQLPGKAAYAGPAGASLIGMQPKWQSASLALDGYLDRQGVTIGAADELQGAIAHVTGKGGYEAVKFAPGRTFVMPDATVVIDGSHAFLEAQGTIMDFAALTGTKPAIWVQGSEDPPYNQRTNVFRRLRLKGPHTTQGTSKVIGILFEGLVGGENGPSHISIADSIIKNFAIGIQHGHNSYLNHNVNIGITGCDYGIDIKGSALNATENILYRRGVINGCTCAIRQRDISGAGGLTLADYSIDYNAKLAEIVGRAGVTLLAGWHEVSQYKQIPIEFLPDPGGSYDGAYFVWKDGRMVIRDVGPTFPIWADVPAGAYCEVDAVFASNTQSTLLTNFTGAGRSKWRTQHSYDLHRNNPIAHSVRSGLIDGSFRGGAVPPDVSIVSDTAGISSPINGTNIKLSTPTDRPFDSPFSLKFDKINGAGSNAGFILSAQQCNYDELMGGQFWYCKPGAQTGTLFVQHFWAVLTKNGNGNLEINYNENIGDLAITFTSTPTDWTQVTFPGGNLTASRKPRWATHRIVLINGVNMGPGPLYFGRRSLEAI